MQYALDAQSTIGFLRNRGPGREYKTGNRSGWSMTGADSDR